MAIETTSIPALETAEAYTATAFRPLTTVAAAAGPPLEHATLPALATACHQTAPASATTAIHIY